MVWVELVELTTEVWWLVSNSCQKLNVTAGS